MSNVCLSRKHQIRAVRRDGMHKSRQLFPFAVWQFQRKRQLFKEEQFCIGNAFYYFKFNTKINGILINCVNSNTPLSF